MAIAAKEAKSSADESRQSRKPSKQLPTFRVKVTTQLEILRAYASLSGDDRKGVTNSQLADVLDMAQTTISACNPFFLDVGLLEKGQGGYVPAPEVGDYFRMNEWDKEKAPKKLRPIIEKSWFSEKVLRKLRLRPLSIEEAIHELADEASAGPDSRLQLEQLIEYICIAGIAELKDGAMRLISASSSGESQPKPKDNPTESQSNSVGAEKEKSSNDKPSVFEFAGNGGVVQFNISVKANMTELAGWQPDRIAAFFNGIAAVLAAKGKQEVGK